SSSDVVVTDFSLGRPCRILSLVLVRRLLGILRMRWIAPALEIVTNGARTDLIHNDAAHLRCQMRSVKREVRARATLQHVRIRDIGAPRIQSDIEGDADQYRGR